VLFTLCSANLNCWEICNFRVSDCDT